ncbi:hypothetical protein F4780DRAFT_688586 [Xylariomycetidae sp. FL0641]|nr:hypothetical protein F4780DRAFT_688586 [Xylariomycetidae sp. FL0641]
MTVADDYALERFGNSQAWRMIIVNAVFNGITAVVVGLRLWARYLTRAGWGLDDALILLSMLLVNALVIVTGFLIRHDFGHHAGAIATTQFGPILDLILAFRVIFDILITSNKLSAFFFYLRIFPTPRIRRVCWTMIVLVVIWGLANFISEFLACYGQPIDFTVRGPHSCEPKKRWDMTICLYNALGDVAVFAVPICGIRSLQMSKKSKKWLAALFLLSVIPISISFIRFFAIDKADYVGDFTGTNMKSFNYAILEPNLAILCISLPMLKPVARKLFNKQDNTQNPGISNASTNRLCSRPRSCTLETFGTSQAAPVKGSGDGIELATHEQAIMRNTGRLKVTITENTHTRPENVVTPAP